MDEDAASDIEPQLPPQQFKPELLQHAWQPTRAELLWRKWRRWLAIAVVVIIAVVVGISRKVIGLLRLSRR
jgi:hypothetical protein